MARNKITNPKMLARLAAIVGRPVVHAWTRGGTDHRKDAGLADGSIVHVYKDGTTEPSDIRWRVPESK
jgi:hypothetical protein